MQGGGGGGGTFYNTRKIGAYRMIGKKLALEHIAILVKVIF